MRNIKQESLRKALEIIGVVSAGLLLRLVLMPLTFHGDLLFIHHFPALLLKEGGADIYGTWGRFFLERDHWMYYPPLVLYLTAGFQLLISVYTSLLSDVLNDYHSALLLDAHQSVHIFLANYRLDQRFLFVFGAKFGYLLFDVASFAVFLKIFSADLRNRVGAAVRLWAFNPVLIFSTYLMGQYRIYSAFFCLLMIYAFRKERNDWAFLCLACLCLLENYPWMLAPLYFLIYIRWDRTSLLKCVGGFACFLGLMLGLEVIRSNGYVLTTYTSPVIVKTALVGIVRSAGPLGAITAKALLGCGYLLLLFLCFNGRRSCFLQDSEVRWRWMLDVSIAFLLVLYGTSAVSVHYFMWVLPFWLCRKFLGSSWSKTEGGLLIFLLFFFNLDRRALNFGFLMPLDPIYWMSVPSIHEILQPYLPWGKFVGGARVLFSGMCFYLAWKILRPYLSARAEMKPLR